MVAQYDSPVEAGERERLRKQCRRVVMPTAVGMGIQCPRHIGDFVSADTNRVVMIEEHSGTRLAVPLDVVRHLDRYRGRSSLGVGKSAGIAATTAGAISVALEQSAWWVVASGLIGSAAGAVIVYEDWEEVTLDGLALTPVATDNSLVLAASLRF
jgi:hypothetical protein